MKTLFRFALAILAASALIARSHAITCYALTDGNALVTFDSATPGVATNVPITGLAAGFNLVGMDLRTTVQTNNPANPGVGSLWALATDGTLFRTYVINPATAAATPIGPPLAGIDGSGGGDNGWFFGFDPGTDRIRMMNFFRNYELNPNTITFQQQTNLTGFPALSGSAFTTTSFGGASSIYFLEQADDGLYTSANISVGTYSSVGPTGVSFSLPAGLDISGGLTLMAANVGGTTQLYSLNRSTGAATLIGAIMGNPTVRALTIRPATFPPVAAVKIKVNGKKRITTSKAALRIKGTASCDVGIDRVEYKVNKRNFRKADGTTKWKFKAKLKPGKNVVTVRAVGNNDVKSKAVKVRITRE
jgi:hypothetical protein